MVFQQPNPFPMSIYENVVYGLRINGVKDKQVLDEAVEKALQRASIWDEVKDRLHDSAIGLSGWTTTTCLCCPCLGNQS